MRQRRGRTLTFVAKREAEGVALANAVIAKGSKVYADEASRWDALQATFPDAVRINHSEAYSADGANTNQTIIQLRAKRYELQDSMVYLESKLQEARADLAHVSAVLRLFEIGPDETQQFPAHVNLSRVFWPVSCSRTPRQHRRKPTGQ